MMAAVPGVQAQVMHGVNRADMDLSVKPGDDFYEYAGGGWMKANPLTKHPEYSSYGVFNVLI
jgi:putative endopeptidase